MRRGWLRHDGRVARGEGPTEGEEWEPQDDAEMLDESWRDHHAGGRGALRWLVLLLVIPAVAVVVLQLRPDQERSASPMPTTTPSAHPATATLPPTDKGRTPTPRRATGSPRVVTRDVRKELAGMAGSWVLFARSGQSVAQIDFATQRLTLTKLPALDSSGPVAFLATSAGVIVRAMDVVTGYLVPDHAPVRELTGALAGGGPVVPGPDPEHVWVQTGHVNDGSIQLVVLAGRAVGRPIRVPANGLDWIRPDGGGYPLVTTSGGIFDARPDGLHRITTGTVEAVGATGWLVVECDARNRCSRVVVDRDTGGRRRLPGRVTHVSPFAGLIAPDGTVAVLGGVEPNVPRVGLLDLATGAVQMVDVSPIGRTGLEPDTVAWSPDSRWVYLIGEPDRIVAIDVPSRTVHTLELGLSALSQLALRPGT